MRLARTLLATAACAFVAGAAVAQTTTATPSGAAQTGSAAGAMSAGAGQPGAATDQTGTTGAAGMSGAANSTGSMTGAMGQPGATSSTTSTTTMATTGASAGAPFQQITAAPGQDLVAVLQASGQFTTLLKAITATNLTTVFQRPGALTVFAPTDAAFAALPPGQLQTLMQPANASQLQQLVLLHVVNTPIASAQLLNHSAINVATVATGKQVHLDGSSGSIKVDGASVLQPDVKASNGTVFVIDQVLSPSYTPPPVTAAAAATTDQSASTSTTSTSTKATTSKSKKKRSSGGR
jgi:uncharacterized surface protein with fasciclin (FAS1) repeats